MLRGSCHVSSGAPFARRPVHRLLLLYFINKSKKQTVKKYNAAVNQQHVIKKNGWKNKQKKEYKKAAVIAWKIERRAIGKLLDSEIFFIYVTAACALPLAARRVW